MYQCPNARSVQEWQESPTKYRSEDVFLKWGVLAEVQYVGESCNQHILKVSQYYV